MQADSNDWKILWWLKKIVMIEKYCDNEKIIVMIEKYCDDEE